ncbi:N-acetylmuramoyl-L-alanine amidase [Weeksellaceae bacterium TAE3-ERU29]|nr:N-acetylmuramoyl-L-alanine amidase [Weeksellaceae bacterium TAE3-ERU29]
MKNILKLLSLTVFTVLFSFTSVDKRVVVIDAGHGGQDNGVAHEEVYEKDIVLDIAKKVQEHYKNSNVEIILIRDDDTFVPLSERAEYINSLNPDMVLSLHINSSDNKNRNGMEIYVLKDKENSKQLVEKIKQTDIFKNAEVKNARFILLQKVKAPIAFLELGFLTNETDRNYLTSDKGQSEIVDALVQSIQ